MPAPLPTLPLMLPMQPPPPVHGVMVAVDAFDLEDGIATEMGPDPEATVLGRAEPPLQPQPTPMMEGVLVASEPVPPTPNGVSQPGGTSGPTSGGGNQILAGSMGSIAAGPPRGVVQRFRMDGADAESRSSAL